MQIFNFVVFSEIITSHNVLTPHISKIHLLTLSLNVREFESWIDAQKSEIPYTWRMEASPVIPVPPPPPVSFKTY